MLKDHPRLCGEKVTASLLWILFEGSPPPMRGKVVHVCTCNSQCRITPAYAGKSKAGFRSYGKGEDHPRLCGEKLRLYGGEKVVLGSPPPMGGKVLSPFSSSTSVRITPAYAGKSCRMMFLKTKERITPAYAGKSFRKTAVRHAIKDHPRLCGEKQKKWHG